MATRIIPMQWKVEGVLTDATSAKLSDPTGTYGVKRNDLDTSSISAATQADPVVLTAAGHGLSDGQMIHVSAVVGMTELNGNEYYVDVTGNDLALYSDSSLATSVDGAGYTAYTSGGTVTPAEVADGTAMTKSSTGMYESSFTDVQDVSYTAYVEIVYSGATYHIEVDIPARSAVGAMVASYTSLLERVGHYLFGIRSGYSSDQTTDIEECIRDGLRDVYAAHDWSFFKPIEDITATAPYDTGTVEIVDGVVTLTTGTFPSWAADGILKVSDSYYSVASRDGSTQVTLDDTSVDVDAGTSYELGRPEIELAATFEAVTGDSDLTYYPDQNELYPPVRQRHDTAIRTWQQDDPYYDRPIYYSVRTVEFDPTTGSRKRLALYPTPDAAYVLRVPMILRPTMIDETNLYPVGGETLCQVITEACLAAAERNLDETEGRHWKRCYGDPQAPDGSPARKGLLLLAIATDQDKSSPTSLGPDMPRDERHRSGTYDDYYWTRSSRIGTVSLDGVDL